MDSSLSFYLLAEEGGWDCSSYAFDYRKNILSSNAYHILQINVLECRKHPNGAAKRIVKDFEELYLQPLTIKDTFILETQINYLALHSFPAYYLNPLAIDPNYAGEITSIGDLRFTHDGKERTLNEIIEDKKTTPERKRQDIKGKIDFFLVDRNEMVSDSIRELKKQTLPDKSVRKKTFFRFADFFLFLVRNFIGLFCLLYPNESFRNGMLVPRRENAFSFAGILFYFLLFLFDFSFLSFHSLRSRIWEPYKYARRFLKKNTDQLFQDLSNEKDKLFSYIYSARKNHVQLKNDIKDFSKLSSSYIDFKSIKEVKKKEKGKFYRFLHNRKNILATLSAIARIVLFSLFLVAINHGGTL